MNIDAVVKVGVLEDRAHLRGGQLFKLGSVGTAKKEEQCSNLAASSVSACPLTVKPARSGSVLICVGQIISPTNLSFAVIGKLNLKQEWTALHIKWEEGEVHVAGQRRLREQGHVHQHRPIRL